MPKTIDRTLPIKRYKKVVATVELPGVPEGTVGKVRVANGFAWYRYWVDFDNGVRMGQVSHDNLCHQDDWGRCRSRVMRVQLARSSAAMLASARLASTMGGLFTAEEATRRVPAA